MKKKVEEQNIESWDEGNGIDEIGGCGDGMCCEVGGESGLSIPPNLANNLRKTREYANEKGDNEFTSELRCEKDRY